MAHHAFPSYAFIYALAGLNSDPVLPGESFSVSVHEPTLYDSSFPCRSHLERTVDKVSGIFVPSVIVIAVVVFVVCVGFGFTSEEEAIMRAITILVIACPCALGLATPLAITAAVGAASRTEILVGNSSVLDTIRDIDVVAFDKTGTITDGEFKLVDSALASGNIASNAATLAVGAAHIVSSALPLDQGEIFENTYMPIIAALEKYSEHPLGNAVVRYDESGFLTPDEARNVEIHKGLGISGEVAGRRVFVGNHRIAMMEESCPTADFKDKTYVWEAAGRTLAYFGIDGAVNGVLAFGNTEKPEVAAIVENLKR